MKDDRAALLAEDLRYVLDYSGPGHAHERPGVWDTSGKPCEHCARLEQARANLAAYDTALAVPGGRPIRSRWPAARHVQQAADHLRTCDPNLADYQQGYFAVVAARLDEAANEMAWLAPFREHKSGYRPWRDATRMAHGLLGLPDADGCQVCHVHIQPEPKRVSTRQAEHLDGGNR